MQTKRRAGFTLIEILTVIALIGIVTGFAISRFDYRRYRMDANIRFLQNVIIGAQQTAITRNVTVLVMFDANLGRVRIVQDFNTNGIMDPTDSVRYRPLFDGAEFQAPVTTIDGATAAYATGPGIITLNPLQLSIRIAPNGSLSGDAVVYIGSTLHEAVDQRAMSIVGATTRTAFWSRTTGAWVQKNN